MIAPGLLIGDERGQKVGLNGDQQFDFVDETIRIRVYIKENILGYLRILRLQLCQRGKPVAIHIGIGRYGERRQREQR
ncbi:hypothetical protein [Ruegeria profundi]|uniref:hypothetical protein n=1 Tax=Ruegeria profundi TaxID=1685378 RepID=UPI0014707BF6|nr:hypothetical protein [Ruegeria profundi]